MDCLRGLCGSRRRNKKINNWYNSLYENVFLKIKEDERGLYDEVYDINPGFFEQQGYTREKWNRFTKEGKIAVVKSAIRAKELKNQRSRSKRAASPERSSGKSLSLFRQRLEEGGRRKTRKRRN
jgi:hypothetical protein